MTSVSDMHETRFGPVALLVLLAGFALASTSVGCGAAQPQVRGPSPDTLTAQQRQSLLNRADEAWQERLDPQKLETAIEAYRRVAGAAPRPAEKRRESSETRTRAALWTRLARAYQFRADAHLEDADSETLRDNHAKGMDAAKRAATAAAPQLEDAFDGEEDLPDLLDEASNVPSAASPGLYWYAVHLGQWGQTQGMFTLMKYRNDIQSAMNFVRDNRPEYFYGACFRYYGTYWTRLPMGKKPDKSRRNFDRAIDIAPSFLASKVLKARHYATLAGDRQLFEQLLEGVLEADLDAAPAVRPENTVAQRQAERLLKRADTLF
jgi:hypothetical protein